ncbi:hypothetical protein Vadar_009952 [Vaccinium darrowii]|uniref:Uncharacterized protein n=1 Tax=Vaccinium darrowii TaxID=229202 RepID=A0ACB7ZIC4_9ERIC|nr:hypothetical protein Vadar_009952 [Vaccinium darrowii]
MENVDVAPGLTKTITWSTWAPSSIAEKLPQAKDFNGSSVFVALAQETDLLLDGPDQILVVIDVLVASQKRINNHLTTTLSFKSTTKNLELIKKHYCRLSFLLNPNKNSASLLPPHRGVGGALDLVKKLSFDNKLNFYAKDSLFPTKMQTNMSNQIRRDQPQLQN